MAWHSELTLAQAPWYKAMQFPDWRWENPFSELIPKRTVERKKTFASAYKLDNLLRSEANIDEVIVKLCDWMDKHADEKKPMDLVSKQTSYLVLLRCNNCSLSFHWPVIRASPTPCPISTLCSLCM